MLSFIHPVGCRSIPWSVVVRQMSPTLTHVSTFFLWVPVDDVSFVSPFRCQVNHCGSLCCTPAATSPCPQAGAFGKYGNTYTVWQRAIQTKWVITAIITHGVARPNVSQPYDYSAQPPPGTWGFVGNPLTMITSPGHSHHTFDYIHKFTTIVWMQDLGIKSELLPSGSCSDLSTCRCYQVDASCL